MKKIVVLSLVLAMLLCAFACAETVKPQKGVEMEGQLTDMNLHVEFTTEDIHDTSVDVRIYDEFIYDIVDIAQLKVGDTIEASQGEVTVESIEQDGSWVLINGGAEEGGVTLATEDDTNGYYEIDFEMPAMVVVGEAQLSYADTVTINVYKMNDDLSIAGEGYDTFEVPAAEAGAKLAEITEKFMGSVSPYGTTFTTGSEDGFFTEVTINYVP